MGALAPAASWNPQDDNLLKNSVEAGASLEALAKGAVQFSRRYTLRELQERWHSLLYDPIVSEDASMSMIDVERSSSILPAKFNNFRNPKETKCIGRKRKFGSVRCCYYALRKRICHEPFNPMDLSYLVGDCDYVGEEPVSGKCIPPISEDFGLQSSKLGILPCIFAQNVMNNGDIDHTFHSGSQHAAEKHFSQNRENVHNRISHIMVDNLPFSANKSDAMELAPSASFPVHSRFENDLEARPSTFRQLSNDEIAMGSEPEENDVFNPTISDSGTSFHNVEYSSSLPGMSIWRNTSPSLSIDVDFVDKDIPTGDSFELPDNDGNKNVQSERLAGCDAHSNLKLKIEVQHDNLKSPDVTAEGYLAKLSNSLLNLNNEDELLFVDVDGKDVINKTYYDGLSLLLSSPNEVTHDQTTNAINEETVLPTNTMLDPPTACSGELNEKRSHCCDGHLDCSSKAHPLPSASFNSQCSRKGDEPLFCTLNIEDPEIPSNDDVFLPPLSTIYTVGYRFRDCMDHAFLSIKEFSCKEKSDGMPQNLVQRERINHGQPRVSSLSIGLHGLPERGGKHLVGGAGVNLKLSHRNSIHMPSANKTSSLNANNDIILPFVLKEKNNEVSREPDTLTSVKEHRLSQEVGARGVLGEEQDGISSTSDEKELSIDSEDDVPHFSDIEAMILDMDLDPEDQDLYTNEVLKYQHMETKKRIIRLEQGANAYMQRSIASHGALAALYGRHSKHYIKKSEVLLGRSTAEFIVDIDLGRERNGNKISRRQAIIKIDQDGFFSLKNLGKCSISVNNQDVAPGHCLRLNSGCLIEIRGMPFIFESNPVRMKQYVDIIGKTSHK